MILFTGGEDVHPSFYGHTSPKDFCHSNVMRDESESMLFNIATENNILKAGICRGLQFINVMSNGTLMHHITGHSGSYHKIRLINGEEFISNSLHHQMVVPPEDAIVVGWSHKRLSKLYVGDKDKKNDYSGQEVEIVIYPRTKAFGVQYHPEMFAPSTKAYKYFNLMIRKALEMPWENFIKKFTNGKEKDAKVYTGEHGCTDR